MLKQVSGFTFRSLDNSLGLSNSSNLTHLYPAPGDLGHSTLLFRLVKHHRFGLRVLPQGAGGLRTFKFSLQSALYLMACSCLAYSKEPMAFRLINRPASHILSMILRPQENSTRAN
jgi:hypothetical protein